MDDGHANLVANIRRLARLRRWSMNYLADAAGVGRGALSDILGRRQSPTLTTLQRLADALEVPVGRLLLPVEDQPAKVARARLDVRDEDGLK